MLPPVFARNSSFGFASACLSWEEWLKEAADFRTVDGRFKKLTLLIARRR